MIFTKTKLEGVYILTPRVFTDTRGYFFESYSKKEFENPLTKITIFGALIEKGCGMFTRLQVAFRALAKWCKKWRNVTES